MVADLNDVIRSKEAAGRAKDLRVLPILYRFDVSVETSDSHPGGRADPADRDDGWLDGMDRAPS